MTSPDDLDPPTVGPLLISLWPVLPWVLALIIVIGLNASIVALSNRVRHLEQLQINPTTETVSGAESE
jgi:hypothetical protein